MIVDLLVSPLTLAGVAGAGLLLAWRVRRTVPVVFAAGLFGLALLLMTPMVANLLVAAVEREGVSAGSSTALPCAGWNSDVQTAIDTVVLLAGGFERPPRDASDFGALSRNSLERTFALVRLPIDSSVEILITGGGPYAISEAEVIARLLVSLGFDPAQLTLETNSRNTLENANNAAVMLLPGRSQIGLATDALHMPRAAFAFARSGFQVCRVPLASSHVAAFGPMSLIPQTSALDKSRRALHEIAGAVYYRVVVRFLSPTRSYQ